MKKKKEWMGNGRMGEEMIGQEEEWREGWEGMERKERERGRMGRWETNETVVGIKDG